MIKLSVCTLQQPYTFCDHFVAIVLHFNKLFTYNFLSYLYPVSGSFGVGAVIDLNSFSDKCYYHFN